jgi:flagellar protein FliL
MAEQGDGAAAEGDGGKKKKMILAGVAVVLVLALGLAGGYFLGGGGKSDSEPPEALPMPAVYTDLGEKFVLTLQENGRQRYFQVAVTLMSRDPLIAPEIGVHAPLLRGRLVGLFSSQDFATLRTDAGRLALREQALLTVQDVMRAETGSPGVEQIYFTEFVLQ